MNLPDSLRSEVEAALSAHLGRAVELGDARSVGGGCISNATRVTMASGERAFLKWCGRGDLPAGIFAAESTALRALRAANAVTVPNVITASATARDFDWLLLEWLESAPITRSAWRTLGSELADLHRSTHTSFGWEEPNYIGSLPQSNSWSIDWPEFWRSERLTPQLELATHKGLLRAPQRRRFDNLLADLDDLLAAGNADGPSLLHGDLWNDNAHGVAGGAIALIDPSTYYGHREVDLAMASLFGGFDSSFFAAYAEAWPLAEEMERRRLIYQLYYLLVHVNLFGGSYVAGALSTVSQLGF